MEFIFGYTKTTKFSEKEKQTKKRINLTMDTKLLLTLMTFGMLAVLSSAETNLQHCLCYNVETESDCYGSFDSQCKDYIKEVALVAWPSVVGMILFILIIPMAAMCMCFCKCCQYQPGDAAPPAWHRTAFFIIVCICVAGGSICTGFAVHHSDELSDGVEDMDTLINRLVVKMKADINQASDTYNVLRQNRPEAVSEESAQVVEDVKNNITRQANDINDAEEDVLKWDHGSGKWDSRHGITIAFCVIGLFTIVLGFLVGFCNRTWPSYSVVFLLCLFGTLVAIACLAYQTVEQVSNDICNDYNDVETQLLLRANTELGCNAGQTTGMGSFTGAVSTAEDNVGAEMFALLCTAMPLFSGCETLTGNWDIMSNAYENDTVVPVAAQAGCTDPCTLKQCAATTGGCPEGDTRTNAVAFKGIYDSVSGEFAILDSLVAQWGRCQALRQFVDDAEVHLCDGIEPEADKIWIAVMFLMVCMLATSLFVLVRAGDAKIESHAQYEEVDVCNECFLCNESFFFVHTIILYTGH